MTKRQKEQQPMQSSLPETDKVALTATELEENTTVEEVTPDTDGLPENAKGALEDEARKDMMAEVKAQILAELAGEKEKKLFEVQEERKKNAAERAKYVAEMKLSSEPWVDWVGFISDERGLGVELEWNDAYVDWLRAEGVTGVDDDDVVQKYVAMMLYNVASEMNGEEESKSDYEG